MEKVAIFFGSSGGNTENVANLIAKELDADSFNVADTEPEKIAEYSNIIFGTSTWYDGELQDDWAEFLPEIKDLDYSGKTVALFGLGDQEGYESEFLNAMGEIYENLKDKATIVGEFPTDGFDFEESTAVIDDKFVGLAIDEDNQDDLTETRVKTWCEDIKTKFQ